MQIKITENSDKKVNWDYVMNNQGSYRVDTPRSKDIVINNRFGIVAIIGCGKIWTIHNGDEFTKHCSNWATAQYFKCNVDINVDIM